MPNDRMYKQKFICLDCKDWVLQLVWESELDNKTFQCKVEGCSGTCIPFFEDEVPAPMIITGKMTKQDIKSERFKRSREHFKKEVMPTINPKSMEGKHFIKKYGKSN